MDSSFDGWHRTHHHTRGCPKVSVVCSALSWEPVRRYWEHLQYRAQVAKPMAEFWLLGRLINCKSKVT